LRAKSTKEKIADLHWLTLSRASDLIRNRKVSPVQLTEVCLSRIARFNPKLNAFITVTADSALVDARNAEAEIRKGHWRGSLHGVPIALKDLFDTAGVLTTAASGAFKDRVPTQDCEVVRRLKQAGAVLLGNLNMHECAYGASSVVSFFGPVRNPWSTGHIAGGSSSGSAAAVAAGLCYGAMGSDTGGSIRQPSAYCGIAGFKPTYGRVSTRGVIPLSWFYDHVGPMTRTVVDAALMLQAVAGYDPEEPTSIDAPVPDYMAAMRKVKRLRVGIPRAYFYEKLDPEVDSAMDAALKVISKLAARVEEIEIAAGYETTVYRAEAFAYHRDKIKTSPELYQPDTLRRLRTGEDVTATTYIESRRQAEQARHRICGIFKNVDVLITPTTAVPPFTVAELDFDPDALRSKEILSLRNTRPFNLFGLPTISVPCGFTKTGLPIGMQITGAPLVEASILMLAHGYEQHTDWHTRHPNLEV
jgi:aspartyl-tRNA(Asn)/glutamyl-tRNA(Gln) amidotransferase subunit A